jgi:hypothetical protein
MLWYILTGRYGTPTLSNYFYLPTIYFYYNIGTHAAQAAGRKPQGRKIQIDSYYHHDIDNSSLYVSPLWILGIIFYI